MRDALGWSYSAAGFMNTINAAGYLAGALMASKLIKRFGLSAAVRWGTLACVVSLALCALSGNFVILSFARLLAGLGAAAGFVAAGALAAMIAQTRPERASFLLSLFYAGPGLGILTAGRGAERVVVPDRLKRVRDAVGVARRAGAQQGRRLYGRHSRRQRFRGGAAAVRAFRAVAGDIGAGVRGGVLRGRGIDHRLRALQLSPRGMADRNCGDDDRLWNRPDTGAARGWRRYPCVSHPVLCAQRLGGDAGARRHCRGVSEEAGAQAKCRHSGARVKASEPGIHNHDREYGFRACASRNDENQLPLNEL